MHTSLKALAAVLVVAGAAAGISYATNAVTRTATSVLQACANTANGNLRLVADNASDCRPNESAVSWNVVGQTGPQGPPGKDGANGTNGTNGKDGISPTVQQLAANDPTCPSGGASITDAAGNVAYVCNGAKGDTGASGTPFSGVFQSPNGEFKLSVADGGITLDGPSSKVTLDPTSLSLESAAGISVQATTQLSLDGGGTTTLKGALTTIGNGGCAPALRTTDPMLVTVPFQAGGAFPVTVVGPGAVDVCVG